MRITAGQWQQTLNVLKLSLVKVINVDWPSVAKKQSDIAVFFEIIPKISK